MAGRLPLEELGFTEIELIGQGGSADVYAAVDKATSERVAIKCLRGELAFDETERKRFHNELEMTLQLSHENIVGLRQIKELEGCFVQIMEYVAGGNLRQLLAERIPLERAFDVTIGVTRALLHAHGLGIVHRDLKPENVLFTQSGQVKVGDWALARHVADTTGLTKTGLIVGTPRYMAPERIACNTVTPAVDSYALGIMLYEIFWGKGPFAGDSIAQQLNAHLKSRAPNMSRTDPQVPRMISLLALRLLAKSPAKRPPLTDVIQILEAYPEEEEGTPKTVSLLRAMTDSETEGTAETYKDINRKRERRRPFAQYIAMTLLLVTCCYLAIFNSPKAKVEPISRPIPSKRVVGQGPLARFKKAFAKLKEDDGLSKEILASAALVDESEILELSLEAMESEYKLWKSAFNEDTNYSMKVLKVAQKELSRRVCNLINLVLHTCPQDLGNAKTDRLYSSFYGMTNTLATQTHKAIQVLQVKAAQRRGKVPLGQMLLVAGARNVEGKLIYRRIFETMNKLLKEHEAHPAMELTYAAAAKRMGNVSQAIDICRKTSDAIVSLPFAKQEPLVTLLSDSMNLELACYATHGRSKQLVDLAPTLLRYTKRYLSQLKERKVGIPASIQGFITAYHRILVVLCHIQIRQERWEKLAHAVDKFFALCDSLRFLQYVQHKFLHTRQLDDVSRQAIIDLFHKHATRINRNRPQPKMRKLNIDQDSQLNGQLIDGEASKKPFRYIVTIGDHRAGTKSTQKDGRFSLPWPKTLGHKKRLVTIFAYDRGKSPLSPIVFMKHMGPKKSE